MELPCWTYKNKEMVKSSDEIKSCFGFIYRLTFEDGSMYIGKKQVERIVEKPPKTKGSPRENVIGTVGRLLDLDKTGKKTRVVCDIVRLQSDWEKYTGSMDEKTVEKMKDIPIVKREILMFVDSKIDLTYYETKALFDYNAIIDEKYLNIHILQSFYRGKVK